MDIVDLTSTGTLTAVLEVYMNDHAMFRIPENRITSFTHVRTCDTTRGTSTEISFTITDETAMDMEAVLSGMTDKVIKFRYGYDGNMSKFFTALVLSYTPVFHFNRTVLTVKAVSHTEMDQSKLTPDATSSYFQQSIANLAEDAFVSVSSIKPSDIVKKLVADYKYQIGYIEETRAVDITPTFLSGAFNFNDKMNRLCSIALAAGNGLAGFRYWTEETDGIVYIYFSRRDLRATQADYRYEMHLGSDKFTSLFSFECTLSADAAMVGGGNKILSGFNYDTNEFETHFINTSTESSPSNPYRLPFELSSTPYSPPMSRLSNKDVAIAKSNFSELMKMSATAKANMLCDPQMDLLTPIYISLITQSGIPHHFSGVYNMTTITTTLENGRLVSSIDCYRDYQKSGEYIKY